MILWSVALLAPASTQAWVVTPELGFAAEVTLTASGDILSAGDSIGPDAFDFSVRLQTNADGTDLWHYQLDGSAPDLGGSFNDYAADLALDGAGNVVAAGSTRNTGTKQDLQVVKLGGADGLPIWTQTVDSATHDNDDFSDMALAAGGDVAVTGTFGVTADVQGPYTFEVARLAGATGTELWRHSIPGDPRSRGGVVVFDGADHVLAFGDLETTPHDSVAVAVKLDGATGGELWRTLLNGAAPITEYGSVGVVDAAGDFYVGGWARPAGGDTFTIYKLAGATGSVLWRYDHVPAAGVAFPILLSLDGVGNVYAGAYFDGDFVLLKLPTASGVPVWSRKLSNDYYTSLAFNADGDFLLGGSHGHRFAIQKVRATDGHKKWRRTLPANSYNGGFATGVAVDAVGDVIAVGGHVTPLPKGHVNGIHSYTVLKACAVNGRVRRTDNCP
jgi:hypothetical protein